MPDAGTYEHCERAWTAHGFSGLDSFVFGPREVPAPGPGEITVSVTAAGVNPADLKHVRRASDPALLPMPIGYEIAGTVSATGPGAVLGSGRPGGDRRPGRRLQCTAATPGR